MVRTPTYDKNGMKKGAWSEEEDRKLRDYVLRYGHWNWSELPKFAGLKRYGKSCRLRWLNYLCPGVKRGSFTEEEDDLIIKLHEKLGSKWSAIASRLPGRTDNEIKNHWHTHLKKRVRGDSTQATPSTGSNTAVSCESGAASEPCSGARSASSRGSSSVQCSVELSDCGMRTTSMDLAAMEDSDGTSELFAEPVGSDFWTQPFLHDDSYRQSPAFAAAPPVLEESGFLSSPMAAYDMDDADLFSLWTQMRQAELCISWTG